MKTSMMRREDIERNWYEIDAEGEVLGRLASRVAHILRGKHKPAYTPHLDMGDHVVVINASKIRLTGKKLEDKLYYRHSGFPGNLKVIKCKDLLAKHPERVITLAISGMLPKNRLGRRLLKRLKVYRGNSHHQQAQQPVRLKI